jgi:hypothetical protein
MPQITSTEKLKAVLAGTFLKMLEMEPTTLEGKISSFYLISSGFFFTVIYFNNVLLYCPLVHSLGEGGGWLPGCSFHPNKAKFKKLGLCRQDDIKGLM